MSYTIDYLMQSFLENTQDTPQFREFDDFLSEAMQDNCDPATAKKLSALKESSDHAEMCRAFAAGIRAGMDISSFMMKGVE